MQFLLGALTMATFFVGLYAAYALGKRARKPVQARQTQEDEEARRKAQKLTEGFQTLMSYDVTTALKGKKVI